MVEEVSRNWLLWGRNFYCLSKLSLMFTTFPLSISIGLLLWTTVFWMCWSSVSFKGSSKASLSKMAFNNWQFTFLTLARWLIKLLITSSWVWSLNSSASATVSHKWILSSRYVGGCLHIFTMGGLGLVEGYKIIFFIASPF